MRPGQGPRAKSQGEGQETARSPRVREVVYGAGLLQARHAHAETTVKARAGQAWSRLDQALYLSLLAPTP